MTASQPDHAQTLEALERTGERFKELLEAVPAVIYEAEPGDGGRWRYVSPQLRWLLGDEPAEWIADPSSWERRLHPDDRDAILRMEDREVEIARGENATFVSEYRMLHRNGHEVWVRDEARLVSDEDGRSFWRGVLVDITIEQTARHALAATYERFSKPDGGEGIEETGARDVYRVTCANCGAVTASLQPSPCDACRSGDVEAESIDRLLADLKASRREVSDLLEGIDRHLEMVGTSLHGSGPDRQRRVVVSRLPGDPLARD